MTFSRGVADVVRWLLPRSVIEWLAAGPAPPRFIMQDGYADLLNADRVRMAGQFAWSAAAGTWHCRTCQRKAELVSVFHPIWDGPFDEAGAGVVDRRDVPWCLRCEGPAPSMDGQPIRLPWLDDLPVRLRVELFERAAFHRLPVKVERFRPPALDAAPEESA